MPEHDIKREAFNTPNWLKPKLQNQTSPTSSRFNFQRICDSPGRDNGPVVFNGVFTVTLFITFLTLSITLSAPLVQCTAGVICTHVVSHIGIA